MDIRGEEIRIINMLRSPRPCYGLCDLLTVPCDLIMQNKVDDGSIPTLSLGLVWSVCVNPDAFSRSAMEFVIVESGVFMAGEGNSGPEGTSPAQEIVKVVMVLWWEKIARACLPTKRDSESRGCVIFGRGPKTVGFTPEKLSPWNQWPDLHKNLNGDP
ncbi:hypothetical protein PHJA_001526300 [Phtheirospermum japonicum]|uniref:Uncharacterized protein n=1 Tax=Phtheirospermum japonicum TaxID=374723 RepID=A0A830C2G8_9LAMI|nr:hypothetical protein PHJA_001526300 [Phtheirospermum japonicum]